MKIENLGLSVRPYNILKRKGIDTVEQLQQLPDEELMLFRGMGRHSLAEIREKVAYVKAMTNGDRIRSMSDEELVDVIMSLVELDESMCSYCQNKEECGEKLNSDELIPDEWCKKCILEWLRTPVEETKLPAIFEDKQESGLTEED